MRLRFFETCLRFMCPLELKAANRRIGCRNFENPMKSYFDLLRIRNVRQAAPRWVAIVICVFFGSDLPMVATRGPIFFVKFI